MNTVKVNGYTLLHSTAARHGTEVLRELVIKLGATKSVIASTFGTTLHQATFNGHVDTSVVGVSESREWVRSLMCGSIQFGA